MVFALYRKNRKILVVAKRRWHAYVHRYTFGLRAVMELYFHGLETGEQSPQFKTDTKGSSIVVQRPLGSFAVFILNYPIVPD